MSKSLITVVDDDTSMSRMLARVIRAAGHDVEIFNSAEEFLASDRIQHSACLILDIDLPGMSGLELQQLLNELSAGIPIIFISGQASEQSRETVLRAGAVDFFDKPFSINSLLAAINSVGPVPA